MWEGLKDGDKFEALPISNLEFQDEDSKLDGHIPSKRFQIRRPQNVYQQLPTLNSHKYHHTHPSLPGVPDMLGVLPDAFQ